MVRCALAILLALSGTALAAPAMRVRDVRSSVELDALARGRLRLWLGTHVEICRIDTKQAALQGEVVLHLDVAPKRATKVTAVAAGKLPKAVAACLARHLRSVMFGELAPRLVWDGTLELDPDGPSIEVAVTSMSGRLDDFVVRSMVTAALEQPAECMTRFFAAKPVMSAVVLAKLAARGAQVTESTADPGGAVTCVAELLAPVEWPSELPPGTRLRISLLRPTTDIDPTAVRLEPATP